MIAEKEKFKIFTDIVEFIEHLRDQLAPMGKKDRRQLVSVQIIIRDCRVLHPKKPLLQR